MIEFDRVTKRFPDGTKALKEVSLTLPASRLTVIIGPSGCGKTTLMKMINKLEKPSSGDVLISGRSIADLEDVQLRRSIGYVIQRIGLFPHMTILDNVMLVPKLLGWDKDKRKKRALELLELAGLDAEVFADRYPLELSGGQQQRVGVIRALAGDPKILLMDEPFSALDPISREQLQDEFRKLQKDIRKTIIFVTHDMDEALKIADFLVVMREGEVEQTGTPQEVVAQPANDFVREFIGTERIERQRTFNLQQLHEFRFLFTAGKAAEVLPIAGSATIEHAFEALEASGSSLLAIELEDGEIVYAGHRELMQAALAAGKGERHGQLS
ncbi:ABC transporter ATP-binding protein [Planomicrobium sp. YIM 101495]|uniref:ABC transporter ATP-binding protein n=1 Tax=Planomicrobium sp. YIM 101495 TaxID=2665160 RepID=UPI0012B8FBC9|nr:betaine/proline/choline family ABC transporter ATP-binding protein [Planomicrobium sp. YIM 101495]MTD31527.1 betaine/proline/choline family ABC transporter ATP-binding protein [Planomicrobium sp. YIM 101495]